VPFVEHGTKDGTLPASKIENKETIVSNLVYEFFFDDVCERQLGSLKSKLEVQPVLTAYTPTD
jgi:hypothetical protein